MAFYKYGGALILALGLAVAMPASAAPPAADTGAAALRTFVDHVATFTADFAQTQTDEKGQVIQQQSGQVWLERASGKGGQGRFRWAYEKPYAQLLVCDGRQIWVYDPDLEQVTVRSAAQALAGSPAQLLSQRATLTEAFNVASDGDADGEQHVKLTPKDTQSDFKSVSLVLKGGAPVQMVFRDQLGNTTTVDFTNVKTNVDIPARQFEFKPPQGVTVVGAGGGGQGG